MKQILCFFLIACTFILCSYDMSRGEDVSSFLEEMKTSQGITYVSGGVGFEEREALTQVGSKYSLKLIFALSSGEYLNDVRVEITDAEGIEVINAVSAGPWFFASLKDGSYSILVTSKDMTKTLKNIQILEERQKVLHIHWPKL
jgi:hypothetical protein